MKKKPSQTKSQVDAAKRFSSLKTHVLKALTKKPQAISRLLDKLEAYADKPKPPNFGTPSQTRVRRALGELIEQGKAVKTGKLRTTQYAKV